MNKKVVLSVLATAVVASMAASAFAAPKTGLYIGGNVKKFYSNDTLINMTKDARATYKNELKTIGFKNLVYVNFKGQGATIQEMIDLGVKVAMADPLKQSDFLESYGVVQKDGTINGTEVPKVDPVPTGDLKVDSVSAIDAKTIQVTFGQKVNKSTSTGGALNKASYYVDNVALGTWDAASTLTMSEDGRTVTIKLSGKTLVNATDYAIVIDGINDFKNENPVPKYTKVITFNDTVRPTVSGVTYDDSITARVGFSEALSSAGTVVVLDSTGKDVTANFGTPGTATLSSDKKSFTVDLKDAKVLNNVNYTVKIVGAKDLAGNLVNPNPVTVTVKKNITETDAPVATSVEALGYDKVKVTFNEKLSDPGKIAVGAGTAVAISTASTGNATVDSTGLVYTVTLAGDNVQTADGVYTVTLTDFVDLNGNKTASATKAVSFKGDTTAPVFGSSRVEQIGSTQYLVVTYDDTNVQPQTAAGAITGTYIDADGIEKAANIVTTGNAIYDPNLTGKSNAIQIALPATVADYGTYTVTLPKGLVKDTAGNQSAAKQVTFTLGQGSDTAKPKLTEANLTVQGALGADTVKAVFSKPLDKTTAQDVNNYLVDGVAVFSKAVFDTDTKTVKLTLKPGAIDLTGDRLVTVKNVKDVSGNVMETVNFSKGFTENVKPTLVSAALTTPKTITLTFSEDLKLSTIEGVKADADKDLVIYSGTDALTLATTATIAKDGDDKHFVVTLAADVTADQLAKALTVEVLSSNDIVDVATPANGLAATTVNVAK